MSVNFLRRTLLTAACACMALPALAAADSANTPLTDPVAEIQTNLGTIVVELAQKQAPITVKNFIAYAEKGFYKGTIFHRVIDGFMVQGGGFTADLTQKKASSPIVNEARGGLSNLRGTIAMARTSDPHSATCQFFINTVDNDFLDARNARDGWGYTVFGRVIKGMDVVDKISAQPTATRYGMRDVPKKTVLIEKVVIKR
ncbi:MAG: peptidylprolyl isomerase [Duodenibacillus sp.]|nr:peptidylprolyl isomerase [Duodenibacillus sp.]